MSVPAPPGFETGATTHPGKVRMHNEDSHLANAVAGLWAVADGMGGHDAGEVASATVVEALGRISPARSAADLLAQCEACIVEANARLMDIARQRGTLIGTTLAVLLAYELDYACVWSGDSRIYRVRAGAITLLSRDHTEVQELVERGVLTPEEGRLSPRRNVVTRAIGVGRAPELEIEQGRLVPNDTFVLCSDGLTSYVADEEIHAMVSGAPQQASDALVALALERGGADNVTVLVVRYGAVPS